MNTVYPGYHGQHKKTPRSADSFAPTTDLALLRAGHPFTWGRVVSIEDVGPYTIVRCSRPRDKDWFCVYIEGKGAGHSSYTIEGALALGMALKHDGRNSQAAHYFLRMIGCPED